MFSDCKADEVMHDRASGMWRIWMAKEEEGIERKDMVIGEIGKQTTLIILHSELVMLREGLHGEDTAKSMRTGNWNEDKVGKRTTLRVLHSELATLRQGLHGEDTAKSMRTGNWKEDNE